ncbi:DUF1214 domain-containing protein [Rhizobium sp. Leaf341]|uniref:DUF1214 domain-containing protein n=1 Tax=Rhizobium sp. Leaf341 TaxID=1736344 RepID=UPI0007137139|nr:DUF1214 domain-containing protein [Rhizobium sp. Leaf341]KQR77358.1 hypothetical protein ASG03_12955 [Rhizobium sp. Leaf341]
MFRVPILVALTLCVAFGGGIAVSNIALKASTGFGAIQLGPWVAYPNAQTADTDPYAKAHRARAGRLLYGKAEGMRFTADTDDDGRPLAGACRYDIVGNTPPARFWTLFATDTSDRPLTTSQTLPVALNAWTVLRATDTSFVIHVAPDAQPDNWLAITPAEDPSARTASTSAADKALPPAPVGRFRLVLTLLDAPTANSSGAIELVMPSIVARGCGDA